MTELYTNSQVLSKLRKLALPICAQIILFNLLGFADVLMLGFYGEAQVAAAGLANKVIFITVIVLIGVAGGASILGAQYVGKHDWAGLRAVYAMAIFVGTLIMLPLAVIFLFVPHWWVFFASSDPLVVQHTSDYLQIVGPTVLLSAVVVAVESQLRAAGESKLQAWTSLVAVLVNILFNWLLIFGIAGLPALEIVGAAWATVIGRLVQTALVVYFLYKQFPHVAVRWLDFQIVKRLDKLKKFMLLSLPLIVNEAMWVVGVFVYSVIFGLMGTQELAVMNMLMPIEGIMLSLFIGSALATQVLVGNELGAQRLEHARIMAHKLIVFLPLFAVLFGVISLGLLWLMPYIYSGLDETTLARANIIWCIFAAMMWIKCFNMVTLLGVLRAGGDTKFVMWTEIITMWGIGLPLAAILAFVFELPLMLVVAAMFVEEALKALIGYWRYRKNTWCNNLLAD